MFNTWLITLDEGPGGPKSSVELRNVGVISGESKQQQCAAVSVQRLYPNYLIHIYLFSPRDIRYTDTFRYFYSFHVQRSLDPLSIKEVVPIKTINIDFW